MIIPDEVLDQAPHMELKDLEKYIEKVFGTLRAMKPGDEIIIERVSKEETRALFMEVIKFYMRSHEWQDGLSFSKGFVALRKIDLAFITRRTKPPVAIPET